MPTFHVSLVQRVWEKADVTVTAATPTDSRAVESTEPVNYVWADGALVSVPPQIFEARAL